MNQMQEYEVLEDCICKTIDDYYFRLEKGDIISLVAEMADVLLSEGMITPVGVGWN